MILIYKILFFILISDRMLSSEQHAVSDAPVHWTGDAGREGPLGDQYQDVPGVPARSECGRGEDVSRCGGVC